MMSFLREFSQVNQNKSSTEQQLLKSIKFSAESLQKKTFTKTNRRAEIT